MTGFTPQTCSTSQWINHSTKRTEAEAFHEDRLILQKQTIPLTGVVWFGIF